MLQLRPSCECCDVDLPPDSRLARICSFECTFCQRCATEKLNNICPNCGGELVRRPVRPAEKLRKNPPSTTRVFKPQGCVASSVALIEVSETASLDDIDVIESGVLSHGRAQAVEGNARNVFAFARKAGVLVAGARGRTEYGRLFVSSLWVAERMRGHGFGRLILEKLEAEAEARGCTDALLDTLLPESVQFYVRCGYTVVASVPRYVGPFTRAILVKPLAPGGAKGAIATDTPS